MNRFRNLAGGAVMLSLLSGCGAGDWEADEEGVPAETTDVERSPEVRITSGSRKVLIIVMNDCATCTLAHSATYYKDHIAGPATPNVFDYYKVVSRGRWQWTGGTTLSVTNPNTAAFDTRAGITSDMGGPQKAARRAVLAAGDSLRSFGASFFQYDINGDLQITSDELTIVVISNELAGGQAPTLSPCVNQADGMKICSQVAYSGDQESTLNVAHELSHTLGTYDLYGNWAASMCHSVRSTVMSCTAGKRAEEWINFDPWHRRKLGWAKNTVLAEPQVTSGTFTLWSPRGFDNLDSFVAKEIVAFANPANPKELIEFERRSRSDNYDQNTVHSGVLSWYTLEHSNGLQLRQLASLSPSGTGGDNGHFKVAPVNCVGSPMDPNSRGRANPLKPGSSYRFLWRDGTDVGFLFTVGTDAGGQSTVSFAKNSTPPSCSNP